MPPRSGEWTEAAALRARRTLLETFGEGASAEQRFREALALRPSDDVLDVGCGDGAFLGRLRAGGHRGELVGIDVDGARIDEARRDYPAARFGVADASSLPFADASFDLVTARYMLGHVADPERVVLEACRVLRPDGRFVSVANAFGDLQPFWREVAAATRGVAGLEPLWGAGEGDRAHDGRVARLAGRHFAVARLEVLAGEVVFPDGTIAVALLETYRGRYRSVPDDVWQRGLDAARARWAGPDGPFARATEDGWRVPWRLACTFAHRPRTGNG